MGGEVADGKIRNSWLCDTKSKPTSYSEKIRMRFLLFWLQMTVEYANIHNRDSKLLSSIKFIGGTTMTAAKNTNTITITPSTEEVLSFKDFMLGFNLGLFDDIIHGYWREAEAELKPIRKPQYTHYVPTRTVKDSNGNDVKIVSNYDFRTEASITPIHIGKPLLSITIPSVVEKQYEPTTTFTLWAMDVCFHIVNSALNSIYQQSCDKVILKMLNEMPKLKRTLYIQDVVSDIAWYETKLHTKKVVKDSNGKTHYVECIPWEENIYHSYNDEATQIPDDIEVSAVYNECYEAMLQLFQLGLLEVSTDLCKYIGYLYKRVNSYIHGEKRSYLALYDYDFNARTNDVDEVERDVFREEVVAKLCKLIDEAKLNNRTDRTKFKTYVSMLVNGFTDREAYTILRVSNRTVISYKRMLKAIISDSNNQSLIRLFIA